MPDLIPDRLPKRNQSFPLLVLQIDAAMRHWLSQHLVFCFEEFDLANEFIAAATGQEEKQGRVYTLHTPQSAAESLVPALFVNSAQLSRVDDRHLFFAYRMLATMENSSFSV
jgi:hypothetical protein